MEWDKLLSVERLRKSSPKDIRNEFESDFGRIIFSPALRRMHDKTQVFPLTTDDNIHSRLTHSNEVMSIGYTFGIKLSQSKLIQEKTEKSELELVRILPVLLKNVCLIHDIGNAPFGHFGETLISDYFKGLDEDHSIFQNLTERQKRDFLFYDGNAQGLRVLTKLQYLDNPFGLNLTYATLASYLKYPNFEITNKEIEKEGLENREIPETFIERNKHGVFFSEDDYFKRIVDECQLYDGEKRIIRHPFCYLMEAADSIAYLCMDMEDGYNKDLFGLDLIKKRFDNNNSAIAKEIVAICTSNYQNSKSAIVAIRIALIQYFVELAYKNFEDNIKEIENGKYNKELIEDDPDKIFKILKGISGLIFDSREICSLETTGHSVFEGLLDYYIKFVFHENKKYVNKAKSLISQSIIDCAIHENLIGLTEKKIISIEEKLTEEKTMFDFDKMKIDQINKELTALEKEKKSFNKIKTEYNNLFSKQFNTQLDFEEVNKLRELKNAIMDFKIISPSFEDLDDYYKFRVILDFLSGMTDQFALNHFQKISGQKIK